MHNIMQKLVRKRKKVISFRKPQPSIQAVYIRRNKILMKYYFGSEKNKHSSHMITIEAFNLEFAIKKFYLEACDYPEKYIEQDIFQQGENNYDYEQGIYKIDENKLKALKKITIPVFVKEDGAFKRISEVDYFELLNTDFDRLIESNTKCNIPTLLTDGTKSAQNKNELIFSGMPVIRNNKDYRTVRNSIFSKMSELKKQQAELEKQVELLKEWMKSKYKVIEAIELYLGTKEEIVALIDNKERADELPLHVYQQKLYMDEEYGIINLALNRVEEAVDFDYSNIEQFDNWIVKNYKMYMPHKKSICVFQVKRHEKDYGDIWENFSKNHYNGITYFLIRNGENLYRIFSGIHVPHSVFPTKKEQEQIYKDAYAWHDKKKTQEQIEKHMLSWKYVTAYLQGLIDRTDILGTNLKGNVNFMLNVIPEEFCVLERNMEAENWIEDKSKPLWRDYLKSVNDKTEKGDIICIVNMDRPSYGSKESEWYWLSSHGFPYGRNNVTPPSTSCFYKVEDICNGDEFKYRDSVFQHEKYFKILYWESDEVYTYYSYHDRKKRTGIWLSENEILNLSKIDEKEIEFYLTDRRYREDYLKSIPGMKVALKMLRDIKNGINVGNKGRTSYRFDLYRHY